LRSSTARTSSSTGTATSAGTPSAAEGVVCKGGEGDGLWMVKIKTDAYLERLKQAFGERWEDYWD
jgi:hypothetical protein